MSKFRSFVRRMGMAKKAFFSPTVWEGNKKSSPAPAQSPQNTTEKQVSILRDTDPECKSVKLLLPEHCCGCGACFNVCPKDAISMDRDIEGFSYPVIDDNKCINCGLCAKTCPVMNNVKNNIQNPECFAVMAEDDLRMKSSSGGVFSLVADYVFANGGAVCGAAFTDDFQVKHIVIENKEDMPKLRGSKYVQSNAYDSFRDVKKILDEGRQLLFSGCPCQVAGLKAFLKKDYDNLLTLDIMCHGAPSPEAFEKYLEETCDVSQIKEFKFRTKAAGYNCVNLEIFNSDGTSELRGIETDLYEKCFHGSIMLRKSCYDCRFCELPRPGDITAGDFWGISQYDKNLNDGKGTSLMLVNSEKGKKVFEHLSGSAARIESVPIDIAVRNNRFGAKVSFNKNKRMNFFELLPKYGFSKAAEYAVNDKYDVGVIGLWYGRNYGSMATYFALHQVLQNVLGLSVLMIENPLNSGGAEITKTSPQRISREFYKVSRQYRIDDLGILNANCDTFMVGSDQLWNIHLSRPYRQMYYLSFANDQNKRIAYGTSFGINFEGTEKERVVNSHFLRKFDHVSVRDSMSQQIAADKFGVSSVQVCDPTFLCPMEEYQMLIDKANITQDGEYLLAYILDPNERIGKELEKLSIEKKCKVIVLLDEVPKNFEKNTLNLGLTDEKNKSEQYMPDVEIKKEVDLYEWLWYYSHAKGVVTDSFHGTIFSIIFRKPFISLINVRRGAQRFVSLLEPIELSDRLFNEPEEIGKNMQLLDELDYTVPGKKLDEIRENSMNWLKNALFAPKKIKSYRAYDIYDERLEEKTNG